MTASWFRLYEKNHAMLGPSGYRVPSNLVSEKFQGYCSRIRYCTHGMQLSVPPQCGLAATKDL